MRLQNPIRLGENLLGFGILWFGSSVCWFLLDTFWGPPGVFSPLRPGFANVVLRCEFVLSAAAAAAGVLIRRRALRALSAADYFVVLVCASIPVVGVFTLYEWARVSH